MPDRPTADEILLDAIERPSDEREVFLRTACTGDPSLLAEVRSLLAAHETSEQFLETPALVEGAMAMAANADLAVGRQMGAYRLVERIGSGGMGSVYLGERQGVDFEQRVAVKLILRAVYDQEALRRFRTECQVLARLEHPNIARMIDGGIADDGTPFIVMEYVQGVPIDQYCSEKQLDVRARLRLMVLVCTAVEHVHRHSTIHRDLKPSNILVMSDGAVKLVDFGIARVLDVAESGTQLTATMHQMMTPPYASPEQMRGEVLSTASDVYSLGVLLYQLLTGAFPYDATLGPLELERQMADTLPTRPSEVAKTQPVSTTTSPRQLRGDLDTILLMALRNEPERRYDSARRLAEDLQRHLDGLPVLAQPDTFSYRAGKFVRRNLVGVLAGAAVLLIMAASSVAGFTLYIKAESARQEAVAATTQAQQNARDAEAVTDFLVDLFQGSDPNQDDGANLTARDLLERGTAELETTLVDQPAAKVKLLRNISEVYRTLGDLPHARDMSQKAVELCRTELDDDLELARSLVTYAVYLERMRDYDPALDALLEAEQLTLDAAGPDHETMPRILNIIGIAHLGKGDLRASLPYMERSMLASEAQIGSDDPQMGYYLVNLAELRRELGDYAEALPLYERALKLRESKLGSQHPQIAMTRLAYGGFLNTLGRHEAALPVLDKSLTVYHELLGDSHFSTASALWELGRTYTSLGRAQEAGDAFARSIAAFEELGGPNSPWLAEPLSWLGELRLSEGRNPEAERAFQRALKILTATYDESHHQFAHPLTGLGKVAARRGEHAKANEYFERALRIRETALHLEHPLLPEILRPYAIALRELGRVDEAASLQARSDRIRSSSTL